MGAGVQFKDAWITVCTGMTDGNYTLKLNNIIDTISEDDTISGFKSTPRI
jgi:hypothetical protein